MYMLAPALLPELALLPASVQAVAVVIARSSTAVDPQAAGTKQQPAQSATSVRELSCPTSVNVSLSHLVTNTL